MNSYEQVERELQTRQPGWWDRVVEAIPELDSLAGTPQPPMYHAEGDVAEHTRLTVEACPQSCEPDLLWAALFHDVGKPLVTREEGDRITCHGHHGVGAEVAERILMRLQMPPERRDRIVWAIKNHTFHLSWNLSSPEQASRRQRRFIAGPRFPLLLELLRVDSVASLGHPRSMQAYELYSLLLKQVVSEEPGRK